ncbi:MAG: filamentous hemagglutinin N-terminal domain-containing protein [Candidatus Binataceae bacterium]
MAVRAAGQRRQGCIVQRSRAKAPQLKSWAVALAIAAAAVLGVAPAWALPQGGVVQAGAAKIKYRGPTVLDIVQSTPQVVISWLSFSIGANETVNFSGPSASAAALNLVTGTNSSLIRGELTANGQVFTVNLSGVLYGKEAAVTVGGLVTTTATGFESQQTRESTDPARPDNMFHPVRGNFGAHGGFDECALDTSIQFWSRAHSSLVGLGALLAAGLAWRVLRRSA